MYSPHIKKQDYVPRPPQMEYTRFPWAANEPPRAPLCGVSSRPLFPQDKESFFEIHRTQKKRLSFSRSLANSICWIRYTDLKHYLVDWNERRRLLENTNRFSSCDVMLPELSLSSGNSKWSSVGRTTVQSHEP